MLDLADLVWARDPNDGYFQGSITELGAVYYEVTPIDKGRQKRNFPIDDIFPACEAKSDNDDNCKCDKKEVSSFVLIGVACSPRNDVKIYFFFIKIKS